jgi:hypothetical protein
VNAIEVLRGNICISATGKKEKASDVRASVKRGFVYDIDRAEYVMNNIKHPHALLEDSRTVWTCETRGERILSSDGEEHGFPGRVRGLAINDRFFFVGRSKNRLGSRTRGELKGYEGTCCVYRLARGSEEAEILVDFSPVRDEIYELMLV